MQELWLPNWVLKDRLVCLADGSCPGHPAPPGLSPADTAALAWNPVYALTNVPEAQRRFDQLQVSVEVVRPTWSLSVSGVLTSLEGNLDNVTGYDDPASFSAGPYVRVNEGVNSYGKLPNYADQEMKVSFFAELPWQLRGGVFWTRASGDHFAPYFTISGSGFYQYTTSDRQIIDSSFLYSLNGHRVFIGPRGLQQHRRRAQFDVRLERELPLQGRRAMVTLDIFNVINSAIVTDVNRSVNRGQNYFAGGGAGADVGLRGHRSERVLPGDPSAGASPQGAAGSGHGVLSGAAWGAPRPAANR